MTLFTPVAVPIDSHLRRKAEVVKMGDIIGGRGQRFLVIELASDAEYEAVSDWIGNHMPPAPYGGPL